MFRKLVCILFCFLFLVSNSLYVFAKPHNESYERREERKQEELLKEKETSNEKEKSSKEDFEVKDLGVATGFIQYNKTVNKTNVVTDNKNFDPSKYDVNDPSTWEKLEKDGTGYDETVRIASPGKDENGNIIPPSRIDPSNTSVEDGVKLTINDKGEITGGTYKGQPVEVTLVDTSTEYGEKYNAINPDNSYGESWIGQETMDHCDRKTYKITVKVPKEPEPAPVEKKPAPKPKRVSCSVSVTNLSNPSMGSILNVGDTGKLSIRVSNSADYCEFSSDYFKEISPSSILYVTAYTETFTASKVGTFSCNIYCENEANQASDNCTFAIKNIDDPDPEIPVDEKKEEIIPEPIPDPLYVNANITKTKPTSYSYFKKLECGILNINAGLHPDYVKINFPIGLEQYNRIVPFSNFINGNYSVEFRIPQSMEDGEYRINVQAIEGGRIAESNPIFVVKGNSFDDLRTRIVK